MRHRNNPLRQIIGVATCSTGAWLTSGFLHTELEFIPLIFALFTVLSALSATFKILIFVIPQIWRYVRIWRVKNKIGSAGWATPREMRKAKLHKRTGFFVGAYNKYAVFFDIVSSALVLAPAGAGKTRDFVIPNLLFNRMNMIVIDLKGTLACVTAKAREKYFKHLIFYLNPVGMYASILGIGACYNPLQILIDDWQDPEKHKMLFADARSIAKQLSPDPKVLTDNQYFRNGSAKFMLFALIHLVTTDENPTLTKALALLCNMNKLESELYEAACGDVLKGDLARLATDIITKVEEGDAKQTESFREGAAQALEDYSPSGALAECTSKTDFRFFDMRNKRMSVYMMADPTVQAVFEGWIGLVSWCATTELIRHSDGKPVGYMGDEITNFKVNGLPQLLTKAREYKLLMILVVQELEEWVNTYGRESLETLLSQTEAKLFLGATNKTSELISRMLGKTPQMNLNYNLGSSFFDPFTRSLSEGGRDLMTADEVRRDEKIIFIYRKMKPMRLDPIGYHQISPLKHRAGINPLFGRNYKGWTKLSV